MDGALNGGTTSKSLKSEPSIHEDEQFDYSQDTKHGQSSFKGSKGSQVIVRDPGSDVYPCRQNSMKNPDALLWNFCFIQRLSVLGAIRSFFYRGKN